MILLKKVVLIQNFLEKFFEIKFDESIIKNLDIESNFDLEKLDLIAKEAELGFFQDVSIKNEVDLLNNPEFIHPLTSEKLKYDFMKEFNKNYEKKIVKKEDYIDDIKKYFYKLWWNLPNFFSASFMLPADPKIPVYSIIDYLDNVLAISVSDKLSLMLVSIGPVQEFIAAARSTIDLKMGSYLLSFLTYQGINVIGEEYGYENVIFPYMRGNYFVKKDLEKLGIEIENYMDPSVASLPNVFTAIVPTSDIKNLERKIRKAIKEKMNEVSNFMKTFLMENNNIANQKITLLKNFSNVWDKQISQFPTILIVSQEIDSLKENLEKHFDYTGDNNYLNLLKKAGKNSSSIRFYGVFSELLGIKSSLRKATRDFVQNFEIGGEQGDDIGGENKAVIEVRTIYNNEERREKLSAISAIKRFFVNYLENKGYIEAYEKLKKIRTTEEIAGEYKLAVLIMDGDNMGKWISGKLAPNMKERLHSKVIAELERNGYDNLFENVNFVTPSYQRIISRTLNNFTNFVPKIVEEFGGLLIYAGGDDVLALFSSNKVFYAANKLRKVYSGIGNVEVEKFIFRDGWCYLKDKNIPVFNMMGPKATMSAGISVANCKFNLKMLLNLARKMEGLAKNNEDNSGKKKNSFAISTVRRSGQVVESRIFWDIDGFDVLFYAQNFIKSYEKVKSVKRLINRLISEYENFGVGEDIISVNDFKEKVIPYIAKKINFKNLAKERFLEIEDKEKFLEYLKILENIEYSRREEYEHEN
ncbi:type III-B CRISPR-associated protein Cas10/Cmr2 [Thermosipho globiformans]|uniref:type III-B CRISPR-associated protein Cas10/Cmr2 n=1 Tax=Thermosipho globiformans TaxID=380685 RepID=UPI0013DF08CA|nr:type III-B CRISPR-associated protein Cas10/Cmr2 [Thermosipho globiformans]